MDLNILPCPLWVPHPGTQGSSGRLYYIPPLPLLVCSPIQGYPIQEHPLCSRTCLSFDIHAHPSTQTHRFMCGHKSLESLLQGTRSDLSLLPVGPLWYLPTCSFFWVPPPLSSARLRDEPLRGSWPKPPSPAPMFPAHQAKSMGTRSLLWWGPSPGCHHCLVAH